MTYALGNIYGNTGDEMKKLLMSVLILPLFIIMLAVNVRADAVATPGGDFIDMYKTFFRDMQANRHQQVWDSLTLQSKAIIAKYLYEGALAANSEASKAGLLEMLEKNTSNIRSEYFVSLNEGFEKMSFYRQVREGKYEIKSSAKDRIVLTITVNKAPKEFQILLENGRWKINFFDDMMR